MGALSPQRSDLTTRINLSPHPPNILFSVSPEGKEKKAQKQKGWLGQQSVRVFNWLDKALPIPVPPLTPDPWPEGKSLGLVSQCYLPQRCDSSAGAGVLHASLDSALPSVVATRQTPPPPPTQPPGCPSQGLPGYPANSCCLLRTTAGSGSKGSHSEPRAVPCQVKGD